MFLRNTKHTEGEVKTRSFLELTFEDKQQEAQ